MNYRVKSVINLKCETQVRFLGHAVQYDGREENTEVETVNATERVWERDESRRRP